MSLTERKVKRTREETERLYHCDLCGLEVTDGAEDTSGDYHRRDVKTRVYSWVDEGDTYPSGGYGSRATTGLECCRECFMGKVVPALRAAGIPVTTREAEWDY